MGEKPRAAGNCCYSRMPRISTIDTDCVVAHASRGKGNKGLGAARTKYVCIRCIQKNALVHSCDYALVELKTGRHWLRRMAWSWNDETRHWVVHSEEQAEPEPIARHDSSDDSESDEPEVKRCKH